MLFGTEIADLYLQPNIGSDIALMIGIAKYLLDHQKINFSYIEEYTEGWAELRESIEKIEWTEIIKLTGLTRQKIEQAGQIYGASKSAIISWAMGLTHHLHGVDNIKWAANLALLRGMIGRPSAGLLPLRGHSNVQGMGSIGVTPTLKKSIFKRWEENGIPVPKSEGLDTMGCMERMNDNKMDFAFCLGGNLYGSNPDLSFAKKSFSRLDQIVYLNTTLNNGHAFGLAKETIILPVLARDEESQKTTQESMFSYVRLSDGGENRSPYLLSEVEVIAEIAQRALLQQSQINWFEMKNHQKIRQWIAKLIPGLEKIAEIEKKNGEFRIPGRRLKQEKFPTDNGKAKFHAVPLPDTSFDSDQSLKMMTVRSEGQFNTVVYEEADIYRGQMKRDVVLMSQEDIDRLGLQEGQRVTIKNKTGEMKNIAVRSWRVKSGNALMYYPEANVLVPRDIDPISKTPAFKSVLISLIP
jgi:molybdopterin-dependent oxidoreductase alpha subunit